MITGAICLSHSPLLDQPCHDPAQQRAFFAAIDQAANAVADWQTNLCIVFFPDHINGFFYDLLPPFCIGTAATSLGDYGTAPGIMDVAEAEAQSLAESVLGQGVDVALSYKMQIDHGAAQPIEMLSCGRPFAPIVPIFINCAAPPMAPFARARALGAAVGAWARQSSRRVLLIASGGLSHDPPLPNIAQAAGEARAALIDGAPLSHAARAARQQRVRNAVGSPVIRPLAPEWDRALLAALVAGDVAVADSWSNPQVTEAAGRGAHETRTWIAALAALGRYEAETLFYAPIDEWLTGMAVLQATPVE